MRSIVRLLVTVALCGVLLAAVLGNGTPSASSTESPPSPMPFVAPFSGSSVPSAEQLSLDTQSRTEFERLGREAAVALAVQDFHVNSPAWGFVRSFSPHFVEVCCAAY